MEIIIENIEPVIVPIVTEGYFTVRGVLPEGMGAVIRSNYQGITDVMYSDRITFDIVARFKKDGPTKTAVFVFNNKKATFEVTQDVDLNPVIQQMLQGE